MSGASSPAETAIEALERAFEGLRVALEGGDDPELERVLAARADALETLAALPEPAFDDALRARLRAIARAERVLLEHARARLEAIRLELDEIGRARDGVRALREGRDPEARFVSRRV